MQLEIDRRNWVNLEELFQLVKDIPDTPSPWKVIIHQFTVDHAMLNLAFERQPVRAMLGPTCKRGLGL